MDTNSALKTLNSWASALKKDGAVKDAFVFGSLINFDGEQFDAQTSDIDIVVVLPTSISATSYQRYNHCLTLRDEVRRLELSLLLSLRRYDAKSPITSVIPVTTFELSKSIHKDQEWELFYTRQFIRLSVETNGIDALSEHIDTEYLDSNRELITAICYCQKARNQYVKTNLHGDSFWEDGCGNDPVPKTLMRVAAQLAYRRSAQLDNRPDFSRIDLREGLEYLTSVLDSQCNVATEIAELRKWLATRRGGRGKASPMSSKQFLLFAELLYDEAFLLLRPSMLDRVTAAANRMLPNS